MVNKKDPKNIKKNIEKEVEVLYEDRDILAINKPAGLMVHGDGRSEEETLAHWVNKNYPETENVGEPARDEKGKDILRGGIVHRLDRETSGVMLVAKTQKGFECLKKQFQKHEIVKEYRAFLYGDLKKDKDVIDRPIGRSSSDFRLWSAQRGARGELREAITEYEVVDRIEIEGKDSEKYTFIKAFPKTGRTHQIRVHFKAIHYPLVADSLYAPKVENSLGFSRLALHSHTITFKDTGGVERVVTAEYPEDFKRAISMLQK
jgi:23S rRNA pseudouridine1911/1915/1917 synthase